MPTNDLRALDASLATAMGWEKVTRPYPKYPPVVWLNASDHGPRTFYPTERIPDAFELVEWMRGEMRGLKLTYPFTSDLVWRAEIWNWDSGETIGVAKAHTVPEAIARAAAKALGID